MAELAVDAMAELIVDSKRGFGNQFGSDYLRSGILVGGFRGFCLWLTSGVVDSSPERRICLCRARFGHGVVAMVVDQGQILGIFVYVTHDV